jgi:hypothetical protein
MSDHGLDERLTCSWSAPLRRTVMPLPAADVTLIQTLLEPLVREREQALPSYVAALPSVAA